MMSTQLKTLESFYFVYGLVLFGAGAYFHDWAMAGLMGAALLFVGIASQYRRPVSSLPVAPPLPDRKLTRAQRLRLNGGSHTANEWHLLCAIHGWRCARCHRQKPLTKDHIIPVIQGGTDDIQNIQPLCRECNSSKNGSAMRYDHEGRH